MAAADVNPYLSGYLNDLDSPEPPSQNPNAVASAPAAGDDLDDLFNYDVDERALFGVRESNINVPARPSNTQATSGAAGTTGATGLGIDEEVKVKKRREYVKLDENRLLSERGIPKLRKIAKTQLKLKGKGHEFSDAQRLLVFYQLWLDDLFPKANFADGLAIIEKLGHKKRIQTMRREWIEEGKPRPDALSDAEDLAGNEIATKPTDDQTQNTAARPRTPIAQNTFEDDLYSVSPQAARSKPVPSNPKKQSHGLFLSDDEEGPDEDELDALLAEDTERTEKTKVDSAPKPFTQPATKSVDVYDDDFEAMAGIGEPW